MGNDGGDRWMMVALTIWEDRISPVFDSSNTLMVARIKDNGVTKKHVELFQPQKPWQLVERLREIRVRVLICGAISMDPAVAIEMGGIRLIPFIGGITEEILDAVSRDFSIIDSFLLPGCTRRGAGQKEKSGKPNGKNRCITSPFITENL